MKRNEVKSLITKTGYGIYLDSIEEDKLTALKEALTVKPAVFSDYSSTEDTSFPVYRLSDTRIYVPKFYGINKYGKTKTRVKEGTDVDFSFSGSLKPHQTEFCEKILNEMNTESSCIANSATGSGKTTMALWLASRTKKKTLIVVHKEFLLNQWIERITQFLPEASIGIIQRNECQMDKDIIIGMIQTMNKRDYNYDSIGLMIIDEAHHMAAQGFSQLFFKVCPAKTLALSATPTRMDGLTKVLEWFCGKIIKNEVRSEVEVPSVEFLDAEYSTNIVPKFNYKGNLNNADMINQLVQDPRRNSQIIDKIVALNAEGRKILILSGRRNHCEMLCEKIRASGIDCGLYLGGMPNEELEETNKKCVIFGTYNMVAEAYDNPDLDTLIMATGMGSVQQSIGRILRKKNAMEPLVVDLIDPEFFGNQARRRKQFYKKSGYNLKGHKKQKNEIKFEESLFD